MTLMLRNSALPNLVDDFFGKDWFCDLLDTEYKTNRPAVNIIENNVDYKIEVAAPGLGKKDFKVDIDDHILTISSKKEENDEHDDERYMKKEFSYSAFKRSFSLPDGVNVDTVKASHKDGILTVSIPKKEDTKEKASKEIKIS